MGNTLLAPRYVGGEYTGFGCSSLGHSFRKTLAWTCSVEYPLGAEGTVRGVNREDMEVELPAGRRTSARRTLELVGTTLILLVTALVLVSPHLWLGFPYGHSVNVNLFWYEPFSEQLFDGELLPRWLFQYWDGLGAPVFYFYAPLPFYLFSVVDAFLFVPGGDFSVLSVGHLLLFFLSGLAFYAVARRFTRGLWATAAAAGYMAAPYHYVDLEVRASMGEAAAYVFVPLVFTSIFRASKTWRSTVLGALAYAGVVLSHLPSALLAAPFVAILSVMSSDRAHRLVALGHALVVGVLGVALACFYVLPALTLRDLLPYDPWITAQGSHLVATSWLLGSSDIHRFGLLVYKALGGTTALGVGSWLVHLWLRKRFGMELQAPPDYVARTLITALGLCWFLMSWPSRWLWDLLPYLPQVQFPWRLGVVIDVCSILLVASFAPPVIERSFAALGVSHRRQRTLEASLCVGLIALLAVLVILDYFPRTVQTKDEVPQTYAPIEYRTRWIVEGRAYLGKRDANELRDVDTARKLHDESLPRWQKRVDRVNPIAPRRRLSSSESIGIQANGPRRSTVSANLDSAATIRVKKIYFPHWRLRTEAGDEIPTYPDTATGLLTFKLPAGRHALHLDRRLLPAEKIGGMISLLALMAVVLMALRWSVHRIRT